MPEIARLSRDAELAAVLAALERDGALVLEGVLDDDEVEKTHAELAGFFEATAPVENDFAGRQTTRTGGLVARSARARAALLHPAVYPAAQKFLGPFCEKIQLNITQIIRLLPGQGEQELHRDRLVWGRFLPREIEPQFNSLWALTDFTLENGATQVVPGSHRWDWERSPEPDEIARAVMPRGSVLLYTGSVIHGGGRNQSALPRTGMNLTYALGWLRQEENQYLSVPPAVAKALEPELQALLGYTMGSYALGYFSPPDFRPGRVDTLPPEFAVGGKAELGDPDVMAG